MSFIPALASAFIGSVIGFIVTGGNPVGAYYGAAIGFSLGMALNPMTPDTPSVGAPDQNALVMSNVVGGSVPDLAGTGKITGHLLCYGNESAVAQYSQSSGGGKGGSDDPPPQITGYKYYMSWVVGIIAGPVDTLYAVYKGEDIVWEGELNCPVSGGKETIVLEGMGSLEFYFGTADQAANSKVGALLDDATLNSPYRNMCWALFDNCYIGEYNRCPTIQFIVKKIPENAFSTKHEIQKYDSNPAHIMWYVLHDLVGLPESWLHSADFAALALTLFNENRGMSVLFDRQQSALNYLESINSHIDNILRYGTDGKFHPKLIRDDYTVGDLPLIDEDVMLDEPTFNRKSWIDTVNEMKVQYTELERSVPILWVFGSSLYGQLGLGDTTHYSSPVHVGELIDWKNMTCGCFYTMGIKTDDTLWAFGFNYYGQLGLDDVSDRSSPVQVGALTDWANITCGYHFTAGLKTDGTLWTFGHNNSGQLGLGDRVNRSSPVQVGALWKSVAGGNYHMAGLKTDGTLWTFGSNDWGQLGLGNITHYSSPVQVGSSTDWASITCGYFTTIVIKTDGTLWAFGLNNYGQLGLGDRVHRSSPVQVGDLTDWASVAGSYHSAAGVKTDGTLWTFGKNLYGQLGLGDVSDRSSPVQVGALTDWANITCNYHYAAGIKTDKTLWTFGMNNYGQLGLEDTDMRSSPVQVGALWESIACGCTHTVGIKAT